MSAGSLIAVRGLVRVRLVAGDGTVKLDRTQKNLITQIGDQMIMERATGISSPPAQATGMRLGTGSTAVAKTGAGAALVTYLSGSNKAFDATYPQSSFSSPNRVITWQASWGAGVATTASNITEAVIVNDTIATDATSTAANTLARVLLASPAPKASGDTLTITWTWSMSGT
ncbi:hypothetical protein [Peterkaempfera griseoplana]|uniref:hypothetical protein n=1 Tax=Peterkaempfera griseoplana TaxID=66896 RepID=UPI0006E182D2|nr:hypothetical protein [Peterkaempfera griseoplana]